VAVSDVPPPPAPPGAAGRTAGVLLSRWALTLVC
jgi:hypothetical protein